MLYLLPRYRILPGNRSMLDHSMLNTRRASKMALLKKSDRKESTFKYVAKEQDLVADRPRSCVSAGCATSHEGEQKGLVVLSS